MRRLTKKASFLMRTGRTFESLTEIYEEDQYINELKKNKAIMRLSKWMSENKFELTLSSSEVKSIIYHMLEFVSNNLNLINKEYPLDIII